jgi:hypothetical protein
MPLSQSDFISTYSQLFADTFAINYQSIGRLRNTTKELHGLVGDAYKMKYQDSMAMSEYGAEGSDIAATPSTNTAPVLLFKDYELKSTISLFDQQNFNADAMMAFARSHAAAAGRREDQFIIDALSLDAVKEVPVDIGNGSTNLTVEKLREAHRLLSDDEVDGDEIFLIMGPSQHSSLTGQTEFSNSLYNNSKPLVGPGMAGFVGNFMDATLIKIGNRPQEGGLPGAGGIREVFMFAKNSTTMGYSIDPMTMITPEEQHLRTSVVSALRAGAKVGDTRGVVKILCNEA